MLPLGSCGGCAEAMQQAAASSRYRRGAQGFVSSRNQPDPCGTQPEASPWHQKCPIPPFPQAAAARSSQHRHKAGLEAHKAPGAPPGTGSFKTRGFIASLPRHFMARLKTEPHSLLKKKKIIIIKQNLFLKALLLQVMWFSFVGSAELNTHCFVFQDLSAHRAQPRSSSAAAEPRRAAQTRRPYTQSRGAPARRQLSPPRQHLQLPAGEPSSTQLSPS